MKKSYRNIILPGIKLNFFKRPDITSSDFPRTSHTCHGCGLVNIPIVGSVRDGYSDDPKYYCENCAIDDYMTEFDFESREAAISWRRRMFDTGYLFHELLIERYLKENNKSYEVLSEKECEMLASLYLDSYNKISRNKKVVLEAIPKQADLEKELKKYCRKVKFL